MADVISVNDIRNGTSIELEGQIFKVVEFLHVKPGKGAAFVRTKLKNIRTGGVVERTFNAGERVNKAELERREYQYLYNSADEYTFMNNETYEQVTLTSEKLGDQKYFLLENMNCYIMFYGAEVLDVELPNTVELTVVETEPGFKGDTATGGTKPARLETGYTVNVPLFIESGTKLKIDTRTGAYLGRA